MKAMVLNNCGPIEGAPLEWLDVPEPDPGPGEIRIRVEVCGICRTDLHVIEGELPFPGHPIIPGHQVVGHIDTLGPGATRFKTGERVGIAWLRHTCGHCTYCREERENLCESSLFTGYNAHGGYAQYAVVPEAFAYPLPQNLDAAQIAPLLCAGIIGYRSLLRSNCRPGQRLALYGFGSSAHIVIQIALHWNCEIYVCTRSSRHRRLALDMGAAWAGASSDEMPGPPDSAIIFAPAGSLVPEALSRLRKGGSLALAGIYMTAIPAMEYEKHLFYEKNIHSVTANTRRDGMELLRLAEEIPIRTQVTTFPILEANQALLKLKHDGIQGAGVLLLES